MSAADNSAPSVEIDLATAQSFQIGGLHVDPPTLQIETSGVSKTIEPRVMQVLVALASNSGSVVSRDRLVDLCWGGRAIGEDAINRCLAKVRRMGTETRAFEIETIPRVGYRLLDRSKSPPGTARSKGNFRRWSLVAVLVVVLAAALIWRARDNGEQVAPTIALGSFDTLNAGADTKAYADGIKAAVSNVLADSGATLISREKVIGSPEQARRDGAALFITAMIRRERDKIHLTVVVDSAQDGSEIFTRDFDSTVVEAGSLPDHVAASIASTISVWILTFRTEPNASIRQGILRTLTLWESNPLEAWQFSRQLAKANPNSPAAQELFALTVSWSMSDIPIDERRLAVSEARAAARRASQLRPDLAYVFDCFLTPPGRLILTPRCDKSLRRALATDANWPHFFSYLTLYFAGQLEMSGRFFEAETLTDQSLARSPYDRNRLGGRMFALQMEHPPDGFNELPSLMAKAQRYWPLLTRDQLSYRAKVANGDVAGAEAMLNDPSTGDAIATGVAKEIGNAVFRAVRTRDRAEIAVARSRCLPNPPEWNPPDPAFATCLVGLVLLGDLDAAFELAGHGYGDINCCSAKELERLWMEGGGLYYPRLELFGSAMAPFRDDPRFIDIARRTGLLAYWRSGHPPDFCAYERAPVCAHLPATQG